MAMRRGVEFQPMDNPSVEPERIVSMEIEGIPIVRDPYYPGIAESIGFWPLKKIVVGPKFDKFPMGERQAVLLHEAYHCQRPHKEERLLLILLTALPLFYVLPWRVIGALLASIFIFSLWEWRTYKHEFDCDRNAAKHGYGQSMITFLTRAGAPKDGWFYPDSEERAARIKKFIERESK